MKNLKKIVSEIVVIAVIGAILIVAGCGKSSRSSSTTQTQTYTVQKGTLLSTVSAIGTVSLPEQSKLTFGTGSSTSSLYTVKEIDVAYGDTVKKGDMLAKIDTSSLTTTIEEDKIALNNVQKNLQDATSDAGLLNAQAAVKNAQATLALAQKVLQDLQTSQLTDAQTAVSDAQSALDNVKRSLAITETTASNNIVDAENNVADKQTILNNYIQANISHLDRWDIAAQKDEYAWELQKAEDNLDAVKLQGDTSIANAQSAVTKAEAALKSAEEDLTEIESDNPNMLKQEAAVATAKANLITAQSNLAYIEAGSNTALLQIQVDNAQAQLDSDNAQLEAATIVAPYDGVVADVYIAVGDKVTATTQTIYLVNTSKVEVDASVDEIDVATVTAGQVAEITLNAITSARLTGNVIAVSPVGQTSQGVVTYPLTISVQNTRGNALKQGMTATVNIVTLNKPNVLLVPNTSITRSGGNSVVQVVNADGTTDQRNIQTGSTNGTQTEVTSGLTEGEKILIKTSTTSSTTSNNQTSTGRGGGGIFIPGGGGLRD